MVVVAVVWLAGSLGFVVGAWWAASVLSRADARTDSGRSQVSIHRHAQSFPRPLRRRAGRRACQTSVHPALNGASTELRTEPRSANRHRRQGR
jgi:hypothetical protein